MPRLRQVPRSAAPPEVLAFYNRLFGDRDPVSEPGTATGTPGNWWSVFALVPYIFEHATNHFGMFGMFAQESISKIDGKVRELAILYFHNIAKQHGVLVSLSNRSTTSGTGKSAMRLMPKNVQCSPGRTR